MASFIGSLLNSIGGGTDSSGKPASNAPTVRTNGPVPAIAGVKRKAESDLQKPGDKAQKVGNGNGINGSRDIKPLPQRSMASTAFSTPNKPPNSTAPKSAPVGTTNSKSTILSSNGRSAAANLKSTAATSKSITASSTTTRPLTSPAPKPGSKPGTASQSLANKPPPKQGSFKAMLAQAAQAQQSKPQAVGSIIHKPAMSAKERLQMAKSMAGKGKGTKGTAARPIRLGVNGKPGAGREGNEKDGSGANGKYQGTAKSKPARLQPTYQGTARPSVKPQSHSGYKGTARPNSVPVKRPSAKPARKYERNEYLGTDEEDEDGYGYEDEDQYTEVSEDYSDMDAGFDDVAEEEREAERQAKLDDLREQKELERLAREKASRKKFSR